MKKYVIALLLVMLAVVGLAAAEEDTTSSDITVTDINIDPDVLMRNDIGTITIEVTNTGEEAVSIGRAELYTKDLTVLNEDTYSTVGNIGAGNTMEFTYTIRADAAEGIYYLQFYLDFREGACYRYYIPVNIENSDVMISVTDVPDSFSEGKKEELTLRIGNPRDNTVRSVIVSAAGEGIETTQTSIFIGDLEPGAYADVVFDVTPSESSEIIFTTEYRNGINDHTTSVAVPVEFGEDKLAAEIVLNSIEVNSGTITGDITNAGLSDAKSIVVTVGDPAEPCDPNPVYVIGALEPDDFSSFEVTFTSRNADTIPVLVEYKDEDGNLYEEAFEVSLNSGTVSNDDSSDMDMPAGGPGGGGMMGMGGFGSGLSQIPFTEILIVILVAIVGVIAWRKGLVSKLRGRIRDRRK